MNKQQNVFKYYAICFINYLILRKLHIPVGPRVFSTANKLSNVITYHESTSSH